MLLQQTHVSAHLSPEASAPYGAWTTDSTYTCCPAPLSLLLTAQATHKQFYTPKPTPYALARGAVEAHSGASAHLQLEVLRCQAALLDLLPLPRLHSWLRALGLQVAAAAAAASAAI